MTPSHILIRSFSHIISSITLHPERLDVAPCAVCQDSWWVGSSFFQKGFPLRHSRLRIQPCHCRGPGYGCGVCGFEPQPGELPHAAGSAKKKKKGFYAEAAILGITRPVMPDKVEHLTSKQPPIDLPEARSWPSATAMPARLACPLWGHLYRVWWTEPGIGPTGGSGCAPPPHEGCSSQFSG